MTDIDNKKNVNWREFASLLTNAMTSRAELLKGVLDPRRDLDNECGYVRDPSSTDYDDMYRKEGVARRVVSIWPKECWQVRPDIWESEDPDDTEFEAAWKKLELTHNVFATMSRIDRLSGVGQFGIMMFGLDDGGTLDKPAKKARNLLYIRTFREPTVTISQADQDPKSPRFGFPLSYNVLFTSGIAGESANTSSNVHWTRCLHVADNLEESLVLGDPRMHSVFNRLQDIRKLMGGSAEMFWQGAFPGLSFEVDPRFLEFGAVEMDTDAIREEMQNYANGLQRWLSTTGVSVKSLAPQAASPEKHVEVQLKAIALSLDVPFRVFMGTEEAKLASSQDTKTWSKRVAERQNNYLTPCIVRPFIERMVELGILPEPKAPIHVDWPDLLVPSGTERAEIAKSNTAAMKDYVQGDVELLIPQKIYLMEVLGFSAIQADKIIAESEVVKEQKLAEDARMMEQQAKFQKQLKPQNPNEGQ